MSVLLGGGWVKSLAPAHRFQFPFLTFSKMCIAALNLKFHQKKLPFPLHSSKVESGLAAKNILWFLLRL